MARLPPFKRFSIEDFQSQKDWIDKLLSPLNEFTTRMAAALNNDIAVGDNLRAQVSTIKVQTKSTATAGATFGAITLPSYTELLSPSSIKVTMTVKPIGLQVWHCVDSSSNPETLHYGVTADWNYSNGSVTINAVSGLTPSKTYILTVALFGG